MKKSRVFMLALGVPLFYLALQLASMISFSVYYAIVAMFDDRDIEATMFSVVVPVSVMACAVFIIAFIVSYHKKPYSAWKAVGLSSRMPGGIAGMSAAAGFFFNVMCIGVLSLVPIPESWNSAHDITTEALFGGGLILSLLFTVLLAPLVEEIVFRGFTYRYFEKIMPAWGAAIASAAVFGLIHFNWLQSLYAFTLGIALAFIYSWTKNLRSSVLFHIAFNGANFVISPVLIMIYGEDIEELPAFGASVMVIAGSIAAFYCMMYLYKNRAAADSGVEPGSPAED